MQTLAVFTYIVAWTKFIN